ncbi:MAG: collagen binding domain-containing protein, partial [Promethearchaeota archaeon]
TIKLESLANLDPPSGPLEPLIYGRQYYYDFFYSMAHNGTGLDGASVNITEDGSQWASIENTGNGHYELTITPMATGDYNIRITFSQEGYETESHVLSFLVDPVPVEVRSISNLVALENTPLIIEVSIAETDTHNPVTGANVTLGVYRPGDAIYFYSVMEETVTGNYSVTVQMPQSETGTYTVRISIEKANHEMSQSFSAALVPTFDPNLKIMQTLLTYSWEIGLGVTIIVAVVAGQRFRSKRKREMHLTAVGLKNRFNDAQNVLGFIVIHKLSGVPIYSKILKGGFEEGMLSAFISAIMHFRAEFETAGTSEYYTVIPISEVIRTVATENLICAFITVTPPSVEQESKMKNYARAIGMMLDATLAEHSAKVIDAKLAKTLEWLFDDLMDGSLVRRYRVGEKKFPKSLRFIEKTIPIEEKEGSFNLARLVRLLASSELSEDEVYIRVFKAIEGEYILPVYPINDDVPVEPD